MNEMNENSGMDFYYLIERDGNKYEQQVCCYCESNHLVYKGYVLIDNNTTKRHFWMCEQCGRTEHTMDESLLAEYFKAKIDRQKVLMSYKASINHAEYETVCGWDGCESIKKKVEGIKPNRFKRLKQHVNDDLKAIEAEITMMHEMIRMGFIPAWKGYNPHEYGVYNYGLVKSDIPMGQLDSIVWNEIEEKNKKTEETIAANHAKKET